MCLGVCYSGVNMVIISSAKILENGFFRGAGITQEATQNVGAGRMHLPISDVHNYQQQGKKKKVTTIRLVVIVPILFFQAAAHRRTSFPASLHQMRNRMMVRSQLL